MTKPIYEIIETPSGTKVVNALYEDGRLLSIPMDEANSDYQAYLNKDKAEQSTPMIPGDE
jgi:hypothetical protein